MKKLFLITLILSILSKSFASQQISITADSTTRNVAQTNLNFPSSTTIGGSPVVAPVTQFYLFATNAYSVTTNGVTSINKFLTCQAMLQSAFFNDPALILNTNVFMSAPAGGVYKVAPGLVFRFESPIEALVFSNYPCTYVIKGDFGNMSYFYYDGPTNQVASSLTFAWYGNATNQAEFDNNQNGLGSYLNFEADDVGFATSDASNVLLYVGSFNTCKLYNPFFGTYSAWTNYATSGAGFQVAKQHGKNVTLLKMYTHVDNGVFINGGYWQGGAIQIWCTADKWYLFPWYVDGSADISSTGVVASVQQDGIIGMGGYTGCFPYLKMVNPPFLQAPGHVTLLFPHPDNGNGFTLDYSGSCYIPSDFQILDSFTDSGYSFSVTPFPVASSRSLNSQFTANWWNVQTTNLFLGPLPVNLSKITIQGVPTNVVMAGANGTFIYSYTNAASSYEVLTNAAVSSIPGAATNCVVMFQNGDPDSVNGSFSWVLCPSNNIAGTIATEYYFVIQNQNSALLPSDPTGAAFLDLSGNQIYPPQFLYCGIIGYYLNPSTGLNGAGFYGSASNLVNILTTSLLANTNTTAPANITTPKYWIPIAGTNGASFRIPVYQ